MSDDANKRFALYAEAVTAGWEAIDASVRDYEKHLVSLGPDGEAETMT